MPISEIRLEGLSEAKTAFDPDVYEKAERAAINELMRQSRTATAASVRERYTIKAGELKKKFDLKLIKSGIRGGKILVFGGRFNVYQFTGTRQTAVGISVALVRGRRRRLPHTFTLEPNATTKRGWKREKIDGVRVDRLGIEKVFGPSASQMFNNQRQWLVVQKIADEKFAGILNNRFEYYYRKKYGY